jgi:hypothetical protein
MLVNSILVEVILSGIIKIHLCVLLDDSIPARIAHHHHACAVSVAISCRLSIASEITSRWSLPHRRAYSSRSDPSATLSGLSTTFSS